MADLGKELDKESALRFTPTRGGPFGPLALEQYIALGFMRLHVVANSFRTGTGALELGARTISFLVYGVMGLGLGIGAGAAANALASRGKLHSLTIEFWVLCLLWQAISIVLASFLEQFDLSTLLRFPVSFGSFALLHLVFGLIDVSTLAGSLGCLGILVGISLARADLAGPVLLALIGFAGFNILLVRAIFAWLDRWLAKRRSREIVSAVFLLSMLSLQLLNPALRDEDWTSHEHRTTRAVAQRGAETWLRRAVIVQAWLPPGLTSVAIESASRHQNARQAGSLGLIGIYVLGAAGLLGIRLRAEYRGESLGEAPGRSQISQQEEGWLLSGRGPVSAVLEKELRTLFRSMTQLYAICVPPIMVAVIASLFRNEGFFSRRSFHLALPVCVAYGLLGFTQLIYNSLGAEAKGIQLVFLFPVPVRRILLAKNLFHGALYTIVAIAAGIIAALRIGHPDLVIVAVTAAWLAFALPANLAAGNMMSVMMAYRVNLGRIGRQSGSQANALLSMLIQTAILSVGGGVVSLCTLLDKLWLAVPVLLTLAVFSLIAWLMVLRNADAMAYRRRDVLIARLARVD